MLKALFIILITLSWVASGTNFQLDAVEIRQLLESRDKEVKELLGPEGSEYTQAQRDQLKNIINDVIHYRSMAEYALGATYNEISEENREEFVSLFSTIIRDNSLNSLDIYRADVTYRDISVDGDDAKVYTVAELDNVRTSVDYDLKLINGEWMITDMTIDSVSTVSSYNRQFQGIIRQRGFDALLQSLKRRAARASS